MDVTVCTVQELECGISNWVKKKTYQYNRKFTLSQDQLRILLSTIVSRGTVEVTGKINLLVQTYKTDVSWHQDAHADILAVAVLGNRLEAVTALLENGANPNNPGFNYGDNTFIHATENNFVDVVKVMRKYGANLSQLDRMGDTAMVIAVKHAYVQLVEFFLDEGNNPDWVDANDGHTLLHHAVSSVSPDSTDVIRLLLAAGANPHLRSKRRLQRCPLKREGWTPLEHLSHLKETAMWWTGLEPGMETLFNRNGSMLSRYMHDSCDNVALAVCMSTHDRLGVESNGLHSLGCEPGLLQLIMSNVCNDFDPEHPSAPMRPTEMYTAAWDVAAVVTPRHGVRS
jgi:hypothetical protein